MNQLKKYNKGILGLFTSIGVSLTMLSACSSTPKEYLDERLVSDETNNHYIESNFYGKVINVHKIEYSKDELKDFKKKKQTPEMNEIMIEGERGTVVIVKTNENFNLNDDVLFKSNKDTNIAKVIKIDKNNNNYNLLKQSPYNYKDISKFENPHLHIDVAPEKNIKIYEK